MKSNKQKTDWVKEFDKLTTDIFSVEGKYSLAKWSTKDSKLKDFISNLLQQQKTEIIKEIEGIVGEDENIEIPETNGEFSLEFGKNRRNELRQEIRERLLLIKNKQL